MKFKKLFYFFFNDTATTEIYTEEYEGLQDEADREKNEEMEKKDIVYDNVAVPEIHFHRKKNRK